MLTVRHTENTLQFKYDFTTINHRVDERRDSEITYKLNLEQRETDEDSLLAFCPIEVYERNFLRNLQQQQQKEQKDQQQQQHNESFIKIPASNCREENTMVSNSLQIPIISLPFMERIPPAPAPSTATICAAAVAAIENIYMSDNMTIIDTDLPV